MGSLWLATQASSLEKAANKSCWEAKITPLCFLDVSEGVTSFAQVNLEPPMQKGSPVY